MYNIYIYRERERDIYKRTYTCVYTYVHTLMCIHICMYTYSAARYGGSPPRPFLDGDSVLPL